MKKKELKEVVVTYCDYCGIEITGNHACIEYRDGRKLDFCNTHTNEIKKTCLDKYKEETIISPPK